MVDGLISYWTEVMNKPNDPMTAMTKKMMKISKVIFTKTINKSEWINYEIERGDLKD